MAITINDAAPTAAHRAQLAVLMGTAISITANTNLTVEAHAGGTIVVNSSTSVTLGLPSSADPGTSFKGINIGAGAVSFTGSGIVQHAVLPATVEQYAPFELVRSSGGWVRVA